ncbi:MAG: anti-sigma factor [Comamonadaceae bacterium]|jgi:anti-sigma factor RsiW|nr:anti-sigma factor [Comamonadaceae bacterium]
MDKPPFPPPLSDAEINALLDGQLGEAERAALDHRLAHDAAARARLDAWRAQREAIRGLHRALLDEPLPPALLDAAQRVGEARQRGERWWRWGGMAAGVLLAFGAGWLAHGQWRAPAETRLAARGPAAALPAFAHDAALAHTVYSPEKRHPVEVAAAEQEHLVQWLSRRTGRPLKVPDLQAQGYALVGGRLLPGEAGARAQFMFQNAGGQRVTLYLGAVDPASAATPAGRETAFRFAPDGPVPGFYWVDQGFGYALSGPLPREALMALAEAVYHQL